MGYRFRPSAYYTSGPVRRPLRRRRRSKYTKAPTAQKQSCWLPLRHDVFTQPRWFADVRHRLERAQWESDICLGERGAAGRLCLVHRPAARRLSEPELAVSRRTRDCARARRISSAWNRQRLAHDVSGGENPRIDGDMVGCGASSFCGEGAVVLTAVKDARRRFAVAFGHP